MSQHAEVYLGLRNQFLATRRGHIGGDSPVYGLLFEVEANGKIITTVATAAGDASAYFSTGGGAIGGIGITEVREAAQALVRNAASLLDRTQPGDTAPPSRGEVSVILLTDDGPRVLRASIASKFQPTDPLVMLIRDSNTLTAMLLRARSTPRPS